mmetsp:Transcript_25323/g.58325  ORF Transcript_25323/g.58325 Transcript_25323/m.58325 type:complete len:300 (+) Transcript_25323:3255-4154(+)
MFTVTAHHHQATVGAVLQGLGVHLAAPELLDTQRKPLSIYSLPSTSRLDIDCLDDIVSCPDNFSACVHGRDWFFATQLNHHSALVKSKRDLVRSLAHTDAPHTLKPIIEGVLKAIRVRMPQSHTPILRPCNDKREIRVEPSTSDVMGMAFESLHTGAGLVIPDLRRPVICSCDEERLVASGEVVNTVDTLFVPFESEIRLSRADVPHLNGAVERGTSKCVGILRVEYHLHHIMRMPFESHSARPVLVPIPHLDVHIVGASEQQGKRRVNSSATNVIPMRLEGLDFLHGVIIEHPNIHIV